MSMQWGEQIEGAGEKLFGRILLLNAKAVGLGAGILFGVVIFLATNWLVIKGGKPVGPHLAYLSEYFIGYQVSFLGSLIGFAYGFAVGTLGGALFSWIYDSIVCWRNQGKRVDENRSGNRLPLQ